MSSTDELVHVRTAGETITATPSHPFWVEGTGWVDGGKLEAGMTLSLADGGRATILSVTRELLASPQDVYNFEVADFHTYFVSSAGVWVHNSCSPRSPVGHRGKALRIALAQGKKSRNVGGFVKGRYYRGHAFDRMQERGITPRMVREVHTLRL